MLHRAIVRKQSLRQYELERAEEALSSKSQQKEELQQAITKAEVRRELISVNIYMNLYSFINFHLMRTRNGRTSLEIILFFHMAKLIPVMCAYVFVGTKKNILDKKQIIKTAVY